MTVRGWHQWKPLLAALVVVLAGCGAEVNVSTKPDKLKGATLASRANTQLGATVTIDRTSKGGHFKIKVDDKAEGFEITGKAVFADLSAQYAD
jgi:hypothetical protein